MPVSKPEEWMDTWGELFAKGDVDSLVQMYHPDAVFVGEPKNPAPTGGGNIEMAIKTFLSMENHSMKLNTLGAVQNGDTAVVYGPWTFDADGPEGPIHMEFTATAVLVKGADGWRATIDDFFSQG